MRFFNSEDDSPARIGEMWGLFHSMGSQEYKSRVSRAEAFESQKFAHTLEIRNSFLSKTSGIRTSEGFHLASYEAASHTRDKITSESNPDIYIAFESDYGDDGQAPLGTVKDSAVQNKDLFSYDNIDNSKAITEGVSYLIKNRTYFLKKVGVDVIVALLAGLRGNTEGIANIREVTQYSTEAREVIEDILTSSTIDDNQDLSLVERIEMEVKKHNA